MEEVRGVVRRHYGEATG